MPPSSPGNSPDGNSPASASPDSPAFPSGPEGGIGGGPPAVDDSPLELLLELLLGLLGGELLGEPDEDGGVLDELGGVELGIDGGCGVVGLLALGQPLRTRQAQEIAASIATERQRLQARNPISFGNFIGIDNLLSAHREHLLEPGAKPGRAQLAHKSIGAAFVLFAVIQPREPGDTTAFRYTEL
jgi:hypothetical protein